MLEDLKLMLGIEGDDLDEKLQVIIDSVESRLKLLVGEQTVPDSIKHIVLDVSIIRFNRIGSEGMAINNVEGENQHFIANDFAGYMAEIQAYLDNKSVGGRHGGFKFL